MEAPVSSGSTRLAKAAEPPNDNSALPIYQQIQNRLRALIHSGELRPGDRLPSEPKLAAEFSTTRATVAHALQQLVFEQLVVREVGRGSFVARPALAPPIIAPTVQSLETQLRELGETVQYRLIQFGLAKPSLKIAGALGTPPDEELYRLERLRISNGNPISLEVRHVPREIGRRISIGCLEQSSFIDILQNELGIHVERVAGTVGCVAASKSHAEILKTSKGDPLMIRDYVLYGMENRPISHGISYYRNEIRFAYVTESRRPGEN